MPPVVHLVRHAEGLHNLGQEYWSLTDPSLTDNGRIQCLKLRQTFPSHSNVELVVSSPLSRAVYSAVEGFLPAIQQRSEQKLILLPDLQEISDFPCDIGCDVESLKQKFRDLEVSIDYSHVDDLWTSKRGWYEPTLEAIRGRARAVRCWLSARHEKEIVVVSHGAFLHFLTEDWEDSYIEEATGWKNAEYRTYNIEPSFQPNDDSYCLDDASMTETTKSRHRRGKLGSPPSREEQIELQINALQIWEQQGYLFSADDRV